jgi:hypothetical protein
VLFFLGTNFKSVILAVCSENVTNERLFLVVQSFTFPSSPPVAIKAPSFE